MRKALIKIFVVLTFLGLGVFIYDFYKTRKDCGHFSTLGYIQIEMQGTQVRIPQEYYSCRAPKKSWKSFALNVSYPEFTQLPQINDGNREEILKKRLLILIYEKMGTPSNIKKTTYEYKKEQIEIVDGIKTKVYPDPPKRLEGGILHYTSKAKRPENLKDMYVSLDEAGDVMFMLECGLDEQHGNVCIAQDLLIDGLRVNYLYDESHLSDAAEIDKKVGALINSMIVSNENMKE